MKILLTGSTGFVGKAVLNRLSRENYDVLAVVRRKTDDIPCTVKQIIGDLRDPKIFATCEHSDNEPSDIFQGATTVIHCAALAHVIKKTPANSLEDYRLVNRDGTLTLAKAAAKAKVRRFIFISSIGVNGKQSLTPFKETDIPAPHDDYSLSKYEAEQELNLLAQTTGMEIVIIRPPLIYGNDAPGNFATLLKWIKRGIPLPLGAANRNLRSFIALPNLVDFIITCAQHPAAGNQLFLVSDGKDLSTSDLLQEVADAIGKPLRLLAVPIALLHTAANIMGKNGIAERLLGSLQIDITKAQTVLNWHPPFSLKETLQDFNGNSTC